MGQLHASRFQILPVPLVRAVSLVLALTLVVADPVFATGVGDLVRSNFSSNIRDLSVPSKWGMITDHWFAPESKKKELSSARAPQPFVVLVQDLHANIGVQKNIAAILEFFYRRAKIHAIYSEAAFGPCDVSLLRSFPTRSSQTRFENKLLANALIAGDEIAAARVGNGPLSPVQLIGVDDPLLYLANVQAFRDLVAGGAAVAFEWKAIRDAIQPGAAPSLKKHLELTEKMLSLKLVDHEWEQYRAHRSWTPKGSPRFAKAVTAGERFYTAAEARNGVMADNLLTQLGIGSEDRRNGGSAKRQDVTPTRRPTDPPTRPVALVTGGFHTANISHILKKRGISFVVVTPQVERLDHEELYVRSMTEPPHETVRATSVSNRQARMLQGMMDQLGMKDAKPWTKRDYKWADLWEKLRMGPARFHLRRAGLLAIVFTFFQTAAASAQSLNPLPHVASGLAKYGTGDGLIHVFRRLGLPVSGEEFAKNLDWMAQHNPEAVRTITGKAYQLVDGVNHNQLIVPLKEAMNAVLPSQPIANITPLFQAPALTPQITDMTIAAAQEPTSPLFWVLAGTTALLLTAVAFSFVWRRIQRTDFATFRAVWNDRRAAGPRLRVLRIAWKQTQGDVFGTEQKANDMREGLRLLIQTEIKVLHHQKNSAYSAEFTQLDQEIATAPITPFSDGTGLRLGKEQSAWYQNLINKVRSARAPPAATARAATPFSWRTRVFQPAVVLLLLFQSATMLNIPLQATKATAEAVAPVATQLIQTPYRRIAEIPRRLAQAAANAAQRPGVFVPADQQPNTQGEVINDTGIRVRSTDGKTYGGYAAGYARDSLRIVKALESVNTPGGPLAVLVRAEQRLDAKGEIVGRRGDTIREITDLTVIDEYDRKGLLRFYLNPVGVEKVDDLGRGQLTPQEEVDGLQDKGRTFQIWVQEGDELVRMLAGSNGAEVALHTTTLYREGRELLTQVFANTAYGATVPVPNPATGIPEKGTATGAVVAMSDDGQPSHEVMYFNNFHFIYKDAEGEVMANLQRVPHWVYLRTRDGEVHEVGFYNYDPTAPGKYRKATVDTLRGDSLRANADKMLLKNVRNGLALKAGDRHFNDPEFWDEVIFGDNAARASLAESMVGLVGAQADNITAKKNARLSKMGFYVSMASAGLELISGFRAHSTSYSGGLQSAWLHMAAVGANATMATLAAFQGVPEAITPGKLRELSYEMLKTAHPEWSNAELDAQVENFAADVRKDPQVERIFELSQQKKNDFIFKAIVNVVASGVEVGAAVQNIKYQERLKEANDYVRKFINEADHSKDLIGLELAKWQSVLSRFTPEEREWFISIMGNNFTDGERFARYLPFNPEHFEVGPDGMPRLTSDDMNAILARIPELSEADQLRLVGTDEKPGLLLQLPVRESGYRDQLAELQVNAKKWVLIIPAHREGFQQVLDEAVRAGILPAADVPNLSLFPAGLEFSAELSPEQKKALDQMQIAFARIYSSGNKTLTDNASKLWAAIAPGEEGYRRSLAQLKMDFSKWALITAPGSSQAKQLEQWFIEAGIPDDERPDFSVFASIENDLKQPTVPPHVQKELEKLQHSIAQLKHHGSPHYVEARTMLQQPTPQETAINDKIGVILESVRIGIDKNEPPVNTLQQLIAQRDRTLARDEWFLNPTAKGQYADLMDQLIALHKDSSPDGILSSYGGIASETNMDKAADIQFELSEWARVNGGVGAAQSPENIAKSGGILNLINALPKQLLGGIGSPQNVMTVANAVLGVDKIKRESTLIGDLNNSPLKLNGDIDILRAIGMLRDILHNPNPGYNSYLGKPTDLNDPFGNSWYQGLGLTTNIFSAIKTLTSAKWAQKALGLEGPLFIDSPSLTDPNAYKMYIYGFPWQAYFNQRYAGKFEEMMRNTEFAVMVEDPKELSGLGKIGRFLIPYPAITPLSLREFNNLDLEPVAVNITEGSGPTAQGRLTYFRDRKTKRLILFGLAAYKSRAEQLERALQRGMEHHRVMSEGGLMDSFKFEPEANVKFQVQATGAKSTARDFAANSLNAADPITGLTPSYRGGKTGEPNKHTAHPYDIGNQAILLAETGDPLKAFDVLQNLFGRQYAQRQLKPGDKNSPFAVINGMRTDLDTGGITDGSVSSGPNARLVQAVLKTRARLSPKDKDAKGDSKQEILLNQARQLADFILAHQKSDGSIPQGFDGDAKDITSNESHWRTLGVFRDLATVTKDKKYTLAADGIKNHLRDQYDDKEGYFYEGTVRGNPTRTYVTDVNALAIKVLGPEELNQWLGAGSAEKIAAGLKRTRVTLSMAGPGKDAIIVIIGHDFTDLAGRQASGGRGEIVSPEMTAEVGIARQIMAAYHAAAGRMQQARDELAEVAELDSSMDRITHRSSRGASLPYAVNQNGIAAGLLSIPDAASVLPDVVVAEAGSHVAFMKAGINPERTNQDPALEKLGVAIDRQKMSAAPPIAAELSKAQKEQFLSGAFRVGHDAAQSYKEFVKNLRAGKFPELEFISEQPGRNVTYQEGNRVVTRTPVASPALIQADLEKQMKHVESASSESQLNKYGGVQVTYLDNGIYKTDTLIGKNEGADQSVVQELFDRLEATRSEEDLTQFEEDRWNFNDSYKGDPSAKFTVAFPAGQDVFRISTNRQTGERERRTYRDGLPHEVVTAATITRIEYTEKGRKLSSETYLNRGTLEDPDDGVLFFRTNTVEIIASPNRADRHLIEDVTYFDGSREQHDYSTRVQPDLVIALDETGQPTGWQTRNRFDPNTRALTSSDFTFENEIVNTRRVVNKVAAQNVLTDDHMRRARLQPTAPLTQTIVEEDGIRSTEYFDSLGRTVLTVGQNGYRTQVYAWNGRVPSDSALIDGAGRIAETIAATGLKDANGNTEIRITRHLPVGNRDVPVSSRLAYVEKNSALGRYVYERSGNSRIQYTYANDTSRQPTTVETFETRGGRERLISSTEFEAPMPLAGLNLPAPVKTVLGESLLPGQQVLPRTITTYDTETGRRLKTTTEFVRVDDPQTVVMATDRGDGSFAVVSGWQNTQSRRLPGVSYFMLADGSRIERYTPQRIFVDGSSEVLKENLVSPSQLLQRIDARGRVQTESAGNLVLSIQYPGDSTTRNGAVLRDSISGDTLMEWEYLAPVTFGSLTTRLALNPGMLDRINLSADARLQPVRSTSLAGDITTEYFIDDDDYGRVVFAELPRGKRRITTSWYPGTNMDRDSFVYTSNNTLDRIYHARPHNRAGAPLPSAKDAHDEVVNLNASDLTLTDIDEHDAADRLISSRTEAFQFISVATYKVSGASSLRPFQLSLLSTDDGSQRVYSGRLYGTPEAPLFDYRTVTTVTPDDPGISWTSITFPAESGTGDAIPIALLAQQDRIRLLDIAQLLTEDTATSDPDTGRTIVRKSRHPELTKLFALVGAEAPPIVETWVDGAIVSRRMFDPRQLLFVEIQYDTTVNDFDRPLKVFRLDSTQSNDPAQMPIVQLLREYNPNFLARADENFRYQADGPLVVFESTDYVPESPNAASKKVRYAVDPTDIFGIPYWTVTGDRITFNLVGRNAFELLNTGEYTVTSLKGAQDFIAAQTLGEESFMMRLYHPTRHTDRSMMLWKFSLPAGRYSPNTANEAEGVGINILPRDAQGRELDDDKTLANSFIRFVVNGSRGGERFGLIFKTGSVELKTRLVSELWKPPVENFVTRAPKVVSISLKVLKDQGLDLRDFQEMEVHYGEKLGPEGVEEPGNPIGEKLFVGDFSFLYPTYSRPFALQQGVPSVRPLGQRIFLTKRSFGSGQAGERTNFVTLRRMRATDDLVLSENEIAFLDNQEAWNQMVISRSPLGVDGRWRGYALNQETRSRNSDIEVIRADGRTLFKIYFITESFSERDAFQLVPRNRSYMSIVVYENGKPSYSLSQVGDNTDNPFDKNQWRVTSLHSGPRRLRNGWVVAWQRAVSVTKQGDRNELPWRLPDQTMTVLVDEEGIVRYRSAWEETKGEVGGKPAYFDDNGAPTISGEADPETQQIIEEYRVEMDVPAELVDRVNALTDPLALRDTGFALIDGLGQFDNVDTDIPNPNLPDFESEDSPAPSTWFEQFRFWFNRVFGPLGMTLGIWILNVRRRRDASIPNAAVQGQTVLSGVRGLSPDEHKEWSAQKDKFLSKDKSISKAEMLELRKYIKQVLNQLSHTTNDRLRDRLVVEREEMVEKIVKAYLNALKREPRYRGESVVNKSPYWFHVQRPRSHYAIPQSEKTLVLEEGIYQEPLSWLIASVVITEYITPGINLIPQMHLKLRNDLMHQLNQLNTNDEQVSLDPFIKEREFFEKILIHQFDVDRRIQNTGAFDEVTRQREFVVSEHGYIGHMGELDDWFKFHLLSPPTDGDPLGKEFQEAKVDLLTEVDAVEKADQLALFRLSLKALEVASRRHDKYLASPDHPRHSRLKWLKVPWRSAESQRRIDLTELAYHVFQDVPFAEAWADAWMTRGTSKIPHTDPRAVRRILDEEEQKAQKTRLVRQLYQNFVLEHIKEVVVTRRHKLGLSNPHPVRSPLEIFIFIPLRYLLPSGFQVPSMNSIVRSGVALAVLSLSWAGAPTLYLVLLAFLAAIPSLGGKRLTEKTRALVIDSVLVGALVALAYWFYPWMGMAAAGSVLYLSALKMKFASSVFAPSIHDDDSFSRENKQMWKLAGTLSVMWILFVLRVVFPVLADWRLELQIPTYFFLLFSLPLAPHVAVVLVKTYYSRIIAHREQRFVVRTWDDAQEHYQDEDVFPVHQGEWTADNPDALQRSWEFATFLQEQYLEGRMTEVELHRYIHFDSGSFLDKFLHGKSPRIRSMGDLAPHEREVLVLSIPPRLAAVAPKDRDANEQFKLFLNKYLRGDRTPEPDFEAAEAVNLVIGATDEPWKLRLRALLQPRDRDEGLRYANDVLHNLQIEYSHAWTALMERLHREFEDDDQAAAALAWLDEFAGHQRDLLTEFMKTHPPEAMVEMIEEWANERCVNVYRTVRDAQRSVESYEEFYFKNRPGASADDRQKWARDNVRIVLKYEQVVSLFPSLKTLLPLIPPTKPGKNHDEVLKKILADTDLEFDHGKYPSILVELLFESKERTLQRLARRDIKGAEAEALIRHVQEVFALLHEASKKYDRGHSEWFTIHLPRANPKNQTQLDLRQLKVDLGADPHRYALDLIADLQATRDVAPVDLFFALGRKDQIRKAKFEQLSFAVPKLIPGASVWAFDAAMEIHRHDMRDILRLQNRLRNKPSLGIINVRQGASNEYFSLNSRLSGVGEEIFASIGTRSAHTSTFWRGGFYRHDVFVGALAGAYAVAEDTDGNFRMKAQGWTSELDESVVVKQGAIASWQTTSNKRIRYARSSVRLLLENVTRNLLKNPNLPWDQKLDEVYGLVFYLRKPLVTLTIVTALLTTVIFPFLSVFPSLIMPKEGFVILIPMITAYFTFITGTSPGRSVLYAVLTGVGLGGLIYSLPDTHVIVTALGNFAIFATPFAFIGFLMAEDKLLQTFLYYTEREGKWRGIWRVFRELPLLFLMYLSAIPADYALGAIEGITGKAIFIRAPRSPGQIQFPFESLYVRNRPLLMLGSTLVTAIISSQVLMNQFQEMTWANIVTANILSSSYVLAAFSFVAASFALNDYKDPFQRWRAVLHSLDIGRALYRGIYDVLLTVGRRYIRPWRDEKNLRDRTHALIRQIVLARVVDFVEQGDPEHFKVPPLDQVRNFETSHIPAAYYIHILSDETVASGTHTLPPWIGTFKTMLDAFPKDSNNGYTDLNRALEHEVDRFILGLKPKEAIAKIDKLSDRVDKLSTEELYARLAALYSDENLRYKRPHTTGIEREFQDLRQIQKTRPWRPENRGRLVASMAARGTLAVAALVALPIIGSVNLVAFGIMSLSLIAVPATYFAVLIVTWVLAEGALVVRRSTPYAKLKASLPTLRMVALTLLFMGTAVIAEAQNQNRGVRADPPQPSARSQYIIDNMMTYFFWWGFIAMFGYYTWKYIVRPLQWWRVHTEKLMLDFSIGINFEAGLAIEDQRVIDAIRQIGKELRKHPGIGRKKAIKLLEGILLFTPLRAGVQEEEKHYNPAYPPLAEVLKKIKNAERIRVPRDFSPHDGRQLSEFFRQIDWQPQQTCKDPYEPEAFIDPERLPYSFNPDHTIPVLTEPLRTPSYRKIYKKSDMPLPPLVAPAVPILVSGISPEWSLLIAIPIFLFSAYFLWRYWKARQRHVPEPLQFLHTPDKRVTVGQGPSAALAEKMGEAMQATGNWAFVLIEFHRLREYQAALGSEAVDQHYSESLKGFLREDAWSDATWGQNHGNEFFMFLPDEADSVRRLQALREAFARIQPPRNITPMNFSARVVTHSEILKMNPGFDALATPFARYQAARSYAVQALRSTRQTPEEEPIAQLRQPSVMQRVKEWLRRAVLGMGKSTLRAEALEDPVVQALLRRQDVDAPLPGLPVHQVVQFATVGDFHEQLRSLEGVPAIYLTVQMTYQARLLSAIFKKSDKIPASDRIYGDFSRPESLRMGGAYWDEFDHHQHISWNQIILAIRAAGYSSFYEAFRKLPAEWQGQLWIVRLPADGLALAILPRDATKPMSDLDAERLKLLAPRALPILDRALRQLGHGLDGTKKDGLLRPEIRAYVSAVAKVSTSPQLAFQEIEILHAAMNAQPVIRDVVLRVLGPRDTPTIAERDIHRQFAVHKRYQRRDALASSEKGFSRWEHFRMDVDYLNGLIARGPAEPQNIETWRQLFITIADTAEYIRVYPEEAKVLDSTIAILKMDSLVRRLRSQLAPYGIDYGGKRVIKTHSPAYHSQYAYGMDSPIPAFEGMGLLIATLFHPMLGLAAGVTLLAYFSWKHFKTPSHHLRALTMAS